MFKADIHMKTADKDGYFGVSCDMHVEDADVHDKMMLMHTLARGLEMSTTDILIFALAEKEKFFDVGDTMEIRIPRPAEEDKDES